VFDEYDGASDTFVPDKTGTMYLCSGVPAVSQAGRPGWVTHRMLVRTPFPSGYRVV
jgi:hypothetical protein